MLYSICNIFAPVHDREVDINKKQILSLSHIIFGDLMVQFVASYTLSLKLAGLVLK